MTVEKSLLCIHSPNSASAEENPAKFYRKRSHLSVKLYKIEAGCANQSIMVKRPKIKPKTGMNPVKIVIRRYGNDSFKYCEKDRFTIVEGEPMHGREGVDRIIFFHCPMKWSDSEKQLNAAERKKVFKSVAEYLDKQKIKWKLSYWR